MVVLKVRCLQVLAPLEDRQLAPTAERALLPAVYRVRRKFGGPSLGGCAIM
jgi:hypothetical protein